MGIQKRRKGYVIGTLAWTCVWACTGEDPASPGTMAGPDVSQGPPMAGFSPSGPSTESAGQPDSAAPATTAGAPVSSSPDGAAPNTGPEANPPGPAMETPVAPTPVADSETGMDAEAPPTSAPPAGSEPSAGCGRADFPEAGDRTIDVDGESREYIVGLPDAYDENRPYRLIFAWHGLGGTASMIARSWYGLPAYAQDSAIYIAGQARAGTGRQGGFASWAIAPDNSDVEYTRALLDWAKSNYCVDQARIFSVGMSNGGMMSNIVGCELGEEFRAIAAMSGGGPRGYATTPCKGQVAAWISHGNRDNNVPFSYGEMSRDYWASQNGCGRETEQAMTEPCVEYQGCEEGLPVQFCEFDGGHTIPDYSAEGAWRFFERF